MWQQIITAQKEKQARGRLLMLRGGCTKRHESRGVTQPTTRSILWASCRTQALTSLLSSGDT